MVVSLVIGWDIDKIEVVNEGLEDFESDFVILIDISISPEINEAFWVSIF